MSNDRLILAKAIDIDGYLSKNGFTPSKQNDRRSFYKSPLRSENDASFVVDRISNRWTDYGAKTNGFGDIIDFVSLYEGCTVSEAITKLLDDEGLNKHMLPEKIIEDTFSVVIEKDEDITSQYLIDYLTYRHISIETAKMFCRQLTYCFHGKGWNHFESIGFQNDCQGWEIRNPSSKICSKPKTVTTIKGKINTINVFEGFFDFLSAYELFRDKLLEGDNLILNSVVFAPFVSDYIINYDEINCYVDNDRAGDDVVDLFMSLDANVIDKRELFSPFNDLNAYLMNQ
jgi:hypothetical protein